VNAQPPGDPVVADARLRWLPWLALLLSAYALAASWNLPLLEAHGFRQTQTAISAYWMAHGGWLAYETPVLGAPWSIPFELPLFQWLALGVANLLPITLDQAGRLTSWLFLVATVWPLRAAMRLSMGSRRLEILAASLLLLSPLLVFWSRAFMIETTATFFGVAFVALALACWQRPRPLAIAALFACGALGALVKITTFFGFGVAAALLLAASARGTWQREGLARVLWLSLPAAGSVLAALLLTTAWVHYGDALKAQTVWGELLGSKQLRGWNFGNWVQKTDPGFWRSVAFGRAAREILGFAWLLPLLALLAAIAGRGRLRLFAFGALACYLLPFAVFTNLHLIHNYYQAANAPFLVVFAACAVEAAWRRLGDVAGMLVLGVLALAMLLGFHRDVLPLLDPTVPSERTPLLASFARAHTQPDEVLLGIGLEWNSEVPYYATRRAMLLVDWVPLAALQRMRAEPASYLGGHRLGMVIVCPNQLLSSATTGHEAQALLAETTAGRTRYRIDECDVFR
jgi:hypothetical protein